MPDDLYHRAWLALLRRIEAKTTWGRNELKELMLACIVAPDQKRGSNDQGK